MNSHSDSPPGSQTVARPSFVRRHLDPTDRLSEVLFGLIMVLTFTLGAGLIVHSNPWLFGATLLALGVIMVGIVIALGG